MMVCLQCGDHLELTFNVGDLLRRSFDGCVVS